MIDNLKFSEIRQKRGKLCHANSATRTKHMKSPGNRNKVYVFIMKKNLYAWISHCLRNYRDLAYR